MITVVLPAPSGVLNLVYAIGQFSYLAFVLGRHGAAEIRSPMAVTRSDRGDVASDKD